VSGSSNIIPAMKVLKEMCIDAKAIADLDFAFKVALQIGYIAADDEDIADTSRLFRELSTREGADFYLDSDYFPKKGGTLTAAQAWEVFAATDQGRAIVERMHERLLAHGIWVWTLGTIETALGTAHKGEGAIQSLEQSLPEMDRETIRTQFAEIAGLLDWFGGGR
jgi:putative ATP-dependent endonuclease of OLD family